MENETRNGNIIKGILFSLGGAVIGVAIWLIAIWLIRNGGVGGGVGGLFASITGMFIGGGYRLGSKRVEVFGYIIAPVFAIISAIAVTYLGNAIILYRGMNVGTSVSNALNLMLGPVGANAEYMFQLSAVNDAIILDLIISVVITVVITIFSLGRGSKKVA